MKKLLLAILVLMSFITTAQVKASLSEDGGWTGLQHKSIHSLPKVSTPVAPTTPRDPSCAMKLRLDLMECSSIASPVHKQRCELRAREQYRHCKYFEDEDKFKEKEPKVNPILRS